jgi:hypothetical protein
MTPSVAQRLRTLRLLWAAISFAVLVLAVAVVFVTPAARSPEPVMLLALVLAAVQVAVLSFVVPGWLFRKAVKRAAFQVVEPPDPDAHEAFARSGAAKLRVFRRPADVQQRALFYFQSPFILSIALSESIALFGLMLRLLGFDISTGLVFCAAAGVLVALRYPRASAVFTSVERVCGARFVSR